jgi:transposase-like protein
MGAALRPRIRATSAPAPEADQQIVAVDETYVRVKCWWFYLHRAIDSAGATIDVLLSALCDADAAKRLF